MKINSLEKSLLESARGLPEDDLLEILDFIQFIKYKSSKKTLDNLSGELSTLDASQAKHLEEEFKDYKNLYPNE